MFISFFSPFKHLQLKPCILWSWTVWRLLMFVHLVAVLVFFFIAWDKVSEKNLFFFTFFGSPIRTIGLGLKQRVSCGPSLDIRKRTKNIAHDLSEPFHIALFTLALNLQNACSMPKENKKANGASFSLSMYSFLTAQSKLSFPLFSGYLWVTDVFPSSFICH